MKILLINPNTSRFVTDRAVASAQAAASTGTQVEGVTGMIGAPIINSAADLAVGAYSALELAAEHADEFDAVGLAVSFDCGLEAVRELLDAPVVGMAEACVRQALKFGDRFAVVSFAERTKPLYSKLMLKYADASQIAAVNCIPGLPAEVLQDPVQLQLLAEEAVAATVRQTDCDSVILLATAFAGLVSDLNSERPVVDCAAALIGVLEQCVSDPNTGALFSSSVFPERKLMQGVSEELANYYENFPEV